ncbi:MAG: hypothetical protein A2381_17740 [Bdellovibrionales bacterium RIFOXYB1_FULL_37_110]|nr:MAG: hypothetical protein A2417_08530 [Bdellovibrionales bacterium RIFOXYC1_FULL_37_79]OFZ59815.1 MAG: hypothetical protein A2381_17740 [Bdellovibrionales bacterium RIFOXYB1_FULL_37_110]OFZ65429.1 MAG: hypothetical protein A2577_18275 [Bdellovibrionales bacterium RIFOXYD1_FULL_36_51]
MGLSNDQFLPKLKNEIIKTQKEKKDVFHGWKILLSDVRSIQSLMLGDEKLGLVGYQEREVFDHAYSIEIFTRHGNPVMMGNSTCNIDPLSPLNDQILKTLNNALTVNNQLWDLPKIENEKVKDIITYDPALKNNMAAAHQKLIQEASFKVKSLQGVKVNSAELYTNNRSTYFETSTGLIGEQDRTDVYFEIAMEKLPLPNTQEVHLIKSAIGIEDMNISRFIDEALEQTLSLNDAILPRTQENAVVLINTEAIARLLDGLLIQMNAYREYYKTPHMLPGQKVFKGEKLPESDILSITIDPTLPIMAASTKFTSEGLCAKAGKVVDNDTVTLQMITHRMGQYLGKPHNCIVGNMIVPLGRYAKEELLKAQAECLEIVSFTSLMVNPSSLSWSSEIKLGKLYHYGKLKSIIKGGIVSGDLGENLCHFQFSNNERKFNKPADDFSTPRGYSGPDAMLIKTGVKIAGE